MTWCPKLDKHKLSSGIPKRCLYKFKGSFIQAHGFICERTRTIFNIKEMCTTLDTSSWCANQNLIVASSCICISIVFCCTHFASLFAMLTCIRMRTYLNRCTPFKCVNRCIWQSIMHQTIKLEILQTILYQGAGGNLNPILQMYSMRTQTRFIASLSRYNDAHEIYFVL